MTRKIEALKKNVKHCLVMWRVKGERLGQKAENFLHPLPSFLHTIDSCL